MKPSYYFLFLTLLLFSACNSNDDSSNSSSSSNNNGEVDKKANVNANVSLKYKVASLLEFPRLKTDGNNIVISHSTNEYGVNYSVEWDCNKKAQRWSCYEMYNTNSVTNWNRNYWDDTEWNGDPFQEDTSIPAQYRTTLAMYRGTGYNRGHMCPSADRLENKEANEQTFYLSNMQPQLYSLNGGIWEVMENQVRTWNKASFRDTLYVVKGGTIDQSDQIKGYTSTGLLIPKYFFMAILCKNKEGYKALAFWVEHQTTDHSTDKLINYVISIDDLERNTGIDFFCNLPDYIENQVEAKTYPASWGLQ
jgi:endonuclease G, mitochondrial